jgi:hypothetical protein
VLSLWSLQGLPWSESEPQVLDEDDELPVNLDVSEQQEFINDVVGILRRMACLPGVGAALGQQAMGGLRQVMGALDGAQQCTDTATLLSLAVMVVSDSPGERYWAAVQEVLGAAKGMTTSRLYSRGPHFSSVQCAALGALRDLAQGLEAARAGGQGAAVEGIVNDMILVAQESLDTRVIPAPEVVQLEAANLVLALAQRLPGEALASCSAVAAFMGSLYGLAGSLPLDVQERLFQAVALVRVGCDLVENGCV